MRSEGINGRLLQFSRALLRTQPVYLRDSRGDLIRQKVSDRQLSDTVHAAARFSANLVQPPLRLGNNDLAASIPCTAR